MQQAKLIKEKKNNSKTSNLYHTPITQTPCHSVVIVKPIKCIFLGIDSWIKTSFRNDFWKCRHWQISDLLTRFGWSRDFFSSIINLFNRTCKLWGNYRQLRSCQKRICLDTSLRYEFIPQITFCRNSLIEGEFSLRFYFQKMDGNL